MLQHSPRMKVAICLTLFDMLKLFYKEATQTHTHTSEDTHIFFVFGHRLNKVEFGLVT